MNASPARSLNNDLSTDKASAHASLEAWLNINRPVFAVMTELNGRFIEQVSKANTEWLGFINRRLNEDLTASRRLMECKTLQDVMTAYSEFFQRAQHQYQAELQYFARLNQKLADDAASVIQTHIDEEQQPEIRH